MQLGTTKNSPTLKCYTFNIYSDIWIAIRIDGFQTIQIFSDVNQYP